MVTTRPRDSTKRIACVVIDQREADLAQDKHDGVSPGEDDDDSIEEILASDINGASKGVALL